jgi:hypothetical protein
VTDPEPPRRGNEIDSATRPNDIEGGYVRPLDDDYFVEKEHRADTSRRLAYSLVTILGGTVVVHYVTILILELKGRSGAVESLDHIFNIWLPVIASLVSSTVTYYFTRER